jgi:hypothetical protein
MNAPAFNLLFSVGADFTPRPSSGLHLRDNCDCAKLRPFMQPALTSLLRRAVWQRCLPQHYSLSE